MALRTEAEVWAEERERVAARQARGVSVPLPLVLLIFSALIGAAICWTALHG